ncbi:MAG: hypothetical protein EOO40_08495 [Deltaproteobacteria bacterium]|nr:MAG: hypothetical protein EOO40_08495 [Deltaproteobacteria bacterium]
MESGSRGQFLGYVKACLRPQGGLDRAASTIYPPTHLCLDVWHDGGCGRKKRPDLPIRPATFLRQGVEPRAEVVQVVQPYIDAVAELGRRPLDVHLSRSLDQSAIASLTAEAMRRSTHSDFGMQNFGGVRATMPAGEVHFSQAFAALPFDNTVVQVRMSGAQIEALLRVLGGRHGGRGLTALAGLKSKGSGKALRAFTSKGKPLEPGFIYTVATSDFIVQGGEGVGGIFGKIKAEDKRYLDLPMRDTFVSLLQKVYPLPTTTVKR